MGFELIRDDLDLVWSGHGRGFGFGGGFVMAELSVLVVRVGELQRVRESRELRRVRESRGRERWNGGAELFCCERAGSESYRG